MRHKWSELSEKLNADPVRRMEIDALKAAMSDALALGDLREAYEQSQQQGAGQPNASPDNVACLETHEQSYLSALAYWVEELGGRLEINAVFPDQTVKLVVKEPLD